MNDRLMKYSDKPNPIKNKDLKIDIQFDITELDLMCSYIVSENRSIRRAHIINMRNVFLMMNMSNYGDDKERIGRINFIMKGIEARLEHNLTNSTMILSHINGGFGSHVSNHFKELSNQEVDWINKTFSAVLADSIIYNDVDRMIELGTRFKATDYAYRGPITEEIRLFVADLNNKFRKSRAEKVDDITFSLRDNEFKNAVLETYRQLSDPGNKLKFGVQALNALTGGGVEAGRVYTFLGLPGEGKSSTLLDIALEIKHYNKDYKCKDPTKRPCVVLLVMENGVKESVERMFNMSVRKPMLEYSENDVVNTLRQEGDLVLTDEDPIDIIIKFRPNLSEDTSYLYTLTEDLEDDGYEVICMIQDYIKRIKSIEREYNKDMRTQLGAVINEFKIFATIKNIPVITASQLNRTATQNIDEARIKNKSDLVRLIGRSNVGESNLILENSDWTCLIAPEYDKQKCRWLGLSLVKTRYYIPGDFYVAYIPYINGTIKFVEDFYSPVPVHKVSLREEPVLNGINSGQGVVNTIKDFTEFNEVKLPADSEGGNMFVNASYAARRIRQQMCHYVGMQPKRQMCRIVNKV